MKEYLGNDATKEAIQNEIIKTVYDSSLPLFRRLIESGQVRISFMNHHEVSHTFVDPTDKQNVPSNPTIPYVPNSCMQYQLQTCRDFESPSLVYLNRYYWDREFLDEDSDTVLTYQDGASLCYPLENLDALKSKALVGALWPREHTPLMNEPLEGACRGMPLRWKRWLTPQRRWEMQQENPGLAAKQHPAPKPRELLSDDYPEICQNGRGPVGHGDFALRSRQRMIKAIETCPHVTLSGLRVEDEPFACKVFDTVSNDFFFGTVLPGIGAPLPIAFEASLFASQMLLPEEAWEIYGFPTNGGDRRDSWQSRLPTIQLGGEEDITVPFALVKPWWYHSNFFLRSEKMTNACPLLSYTFTPDMSRYEETNSKPAPNQWVGIGY